MKRSKILSSKYCKLIRTHLNTPTKMRGFFSMVVWNFLIRFLLLIFPVQKLLRWITPPISIKGISSQDTLHYFYWLKKLKLIFRRGDCLPAALLLFRFLHIAGGDPRLIIGFKQNIGHSWVELSGVVVSEPAYISSNFIPVLVYQAGSSEFIAA